MRYTPYLDAIGVNLNLSTPPSEDQVDHLINVIDSALSAVTALIDWGEYEGRRRKPCEENPIMLTGMPIGQYHCPCCGMMVLAALPHPTPHRPAKQDPLYPIEHYELEYGQPWPPGYEEESS